MEYCLEALCVFLVFILMERLVQDIQKNSLSQYFRIFTKIFINTSINTHTAPNKASLCLRFWQ